MARSQILDISDGAGAGRELLLEEEPGLLLRLR
jgi:hypothetical protein